MSEFVDAWHYVSLEVEVISLDGFLIVLVYNNVVVLLYEFY